MAERAPIASQRLPGRPTFDAEERIVGILLLVLVPLTLLASHLAWSQSLQFFLAVGAVVPLAAYSSGTLVNSYAYDPYGNATSVSEQVSNPYRHNGTLRDACGNLSRALKPRQPVS